MVVRLIRFCVAAAFIAVVMISPAQAAGTVYNSQSAFLAAAGGGLTFESFETATLSGTTVTFPGGTFSCTGNSNCPSFFGVSTEFADTGVQSIFFASPDTATFTFNSPITAFGIVIGGAGDVAPITLTAGLSNGDSFTALGPGYTGAFDVFVTNRQYFGVIDNTPFTSLTFTPSNSGDGIFFDSMSYGTTGASVPEPSTVALLGVSLVLGFAFRRRITA